MSEILFNNIPMMEFFNGENKILEKLPLSVDDLFSLSKDEANNLSEAIIILNEVGRESKKMKPFFSEPILKKRQNKELNKEVVPLSPLPFIIKNESNKELYTYNEIIIK